MASVLEAVLAVLPALQKPTVSSLSDPEWVAVNTVLEESVVRHIVPKLKQAGARGIYVGDTSCKVCDCKVDGLRRGRARRLTEDGGR